MPKTYESYNPSGIEWFGDVPSHWAVKKLSYIAQLRSGEGITSEQIDEAGEYPVYGGNGLRGYTTDYTHEGTHVLIGRQGALCGNVNYASGKFWASEHAIVVTPLTKFNTIWLGELLTSMNLSQYSVAAAQPGLSVETVAALKIPVPPLLEQEIIASFLSRETARMDELREEKEKFLELLELKRTALVAHAVTRGLDENAPLKPSGVEWLWDVPEHWDVERSKWLFKERDERSVSGQEELLTVSHLTGVTTRAEKEEDVNMFKAETMEGYKLCRNGDLAINTMWAWMGAMGTAQQDGIVSPSYNVYKPLSRLDSAYIDFLCRTPAFVAEVTSRSKGVWSSRLRLYPDAFFQIYFPVPPLSEQRAIVQYLKEILIGMDNLKAEILQSLELLAQRRAALIAEAVTGRLDLTT